MWFISVITGGDGFPLFPDIVSLNSLLIDLCIKCQVVEDFFLLDIDKLRMYIMILG